MKLNLKRFLAYLLTALMLVSVTGLAALMLSRKKRAHL